MTKPMMIIGIVSLVIALALFPSWGTLFFGSMAVGATIVIILERTNRYEGQPY
jgi:uncharacterized membrane protein